MICIIIGFNVINILLIIKINTNKYLNVSCEGLQLEVQIVAAIAMKFFDTFGLDIFLHNLSANFQIIHKKCLIDLITEIV